MEHRHCILVSLVAALVLTACGKKDDDQPAKPKPPVATYKGGNLVVPGAQIVFNGNVVDESADVPPNQLVAVTKDGQAYFIYTNEDGFSVTLSEEGSHAAIAEFLVGRVELAEASAAPRAAPPYPAPEQFLLTTGFDITGEDDTFAYINLKVRWAGVKFGDERFYFAPADYYLIQWDHGIHLNVTQPRAPKSFVADPPASDTFGSPFFALAVPSFWTATHNNVKEAFQQDATMMAWLIASDMADSLWGALAAIAGKNRAPKADTCLRSYQSKLSTGALIQVKEGLFAKDEAARDLIAKNQEDVVELADCSIRALAGELRESYTAINLAFKIIGGLNFVGKAVKSALDAKYSQSYSPFLGPAQQLGPNTAVGTYTYDSTTGELVITYTKSTFTCQAPPVGTPQTSTVTQITETALTMDGYTMLRSAGTAGDIAGAWSVTADVNTWNLTLDAEGNVTLSATINDCNAGGNGGCDGGTLVESVRHDLGVDRSGDANRALASDGTSIYLYKHNNPGGPNADAWKVDPATGNITASYPINLSYGETDQISWIIDMEWHNGALWASGAYAPVSNTVEAGVFRVNLATSLSSNQIPGGADIDIGGAGIGGFASNGSTFFASVDKMGDVDDIGVVAFSSSANDVPTSPWLIAQYASELAFGDGHLWVYEGSGHIVKADPATGATITAYCTPFEGLDGLTYHGGKLWMTAGQDLVAFDFPTVPTGPTAP